MKQGLVGLVATAALVLVMVGGVPATAEAATTVDQCQEINESVVSGDRTVELGGNITTDTAGCFDVTASDVTLDGAGNTVTGPGSGNGNGTAVLVFNGSTAQSNVTVRNVTVSGFTEGVNATGATDGTVDGVSVSNATSGITVRSGADKTTVQSVTVTDVDGDGVVVDGSTNATVVGSSVSGVGNSGISLTTANGTSIDDVTVTGNNRDETTTDAGINISRSDDVNVTASEVRNNRYHGVSVENANDTYLADSEVVGTEDVSSSSGGVGIDMRNVGPTVIETSNVSNNVGPGADIDGAGVGAGDRLTIRDTVFNANDKVSQRGDGVLAGGFNDGFGTVVLENVTANRNAGSGFELGDNNNPRILNSTARNNGEQGVNTDANATVVNVVAADNGGVGIDPTSGATVRDSESVNNSNKGIEANANLTARNVTVRNNGGIGIEGSGALDIQNASVRDNDGTGILRYTAGPYDATIRDVVVENSSGDGIDASDNVTIRNATVIESGTEGLDFRGDPGTFDAVVRNATVRDSSGIGIEADIDATFEDVTVESSGGVDVESETNATATNLTVGANTAQFADLNATNVTISQSNSTVAPSLPDGKQSVAHVQIDNLSTTESVANATIAYDEADLDSVSESTLSLYRNDGSGWGEVSGASLDTGADTVSANITSFSQFAVYGDDGSGGDGGDDDGSDGSDDSSSSTGGGGSFLETTLRVEQTESGVVATIERVTDDQQLVTIPLEGVGIGPIDVTELRIDFENTAFTATEVVATASPNPPAETPPLSVEGDVLGYLSIDLTGTLADEVREGSFRLDVSGSDISAESVTVYRYDGSEWEPVDTETVDDSTVRVVSPDGYSVFAVVASPAAQTGTPADDGTDTATTPDEATPPAEDTPTAEPSPTPATPTATSTPGADGPGFEVVLAVVALIAAGVLLARRQ